MEAVLHPRAHALARGHVGLEHRGAHFPVHDESVEQRLLRYRPLTHRGPVSAYLAKRESTHQHDCKTAFFNTIEMNRPFERPKIFRTSGMQSAGNRQRVGTSSNIQQPGTHPPLEMQ